MATSQVWLSKSRPIGCPWRCGDWWGRFLRPRSIYPFWSSYQGGCDTALCIACRFCWWYCIRWPWCGRSMTIWWPWAIRRAASALGLTHLRKEYFLSPGFTLTHFIIYRDRGSTSAARQTHKTSSINITEKDRRIWISSDQIWDQCQLWRHFPQFAGEGQVLKS